MSAQDVAVTLTYTEEEAREVARAFLYFTSNVSATHEDHDRMTLIRDAIKRALPQPKPDEPQGLGAVVEDDRGVIWVRTEKAKGIRNPWQATLSAAEPDDIRQLAYADINAVRELAPGWSE